MDGVLHLLSPDLAERADTGEIKTTAKLGGYSMFFAEDKALVSALKGAGFMNVIVDDGTDSKLGISAKKMAKCDLGEGYKGQKKAVITSDFVDAAIDGEILTLFHWNGFASDFKLPEFALLNQRVTR